MLQSPWVVHVVEVDFGRGFNFSEELDFDGMR